MMGGLMGSIAQGMAFGTGSAIAHRAVGAVAGSMSGDDEGKHQQQEFQQQAPPAQYAAEDAPCGFDQKNFMACLQANNNNASACSFYFEALQTCQMNQQQTYN